MGEEREGGGKDLEREKYRVSKTRLRVKRKSLQLCVGDFLVLGFRIFREKKEEEACVLKRLV